MSLQSVLGAIGSAAPAHDSLSGTASRIANTNPMGSTVFPGRTDWSNPDVLMDVDFGVSTRQGPSRAGTSGDAQMSVPTFVPLYYAVPPPPLYDAMRFREGVQPVAQGQPLFVHGVRTIEGTTLSVAFSLPMLNRYLQWATRRKMTAGGRYETRRDAFARRTRPLGMSAHEEYDDCLKSGRPYTESGDVWTFDFAAPGDVFAVFAFLGIFQNEEQGGADPELEYAAQTRGDTCVGIAGSGTMYDARMTGVVLRGRAVVPNYWACGYQGLSPVLYLAVTAIKDADSIFLQVVPRASAAEDAHECNAYPEVGRAEDGFLWPDANGILRQAYECTRRIGRCIAPGPVPTRHRSIQSRIQYMPTNADGEADRIEDLPIMVTYRC